MTKKSGLPAKRPPPNPQEHAMSEELPDAPAVDDAEGIAAPVVTDPPAQTIDPFEDGTRAVAYEAPADTTGDDGWEDPDPSHASTESPPEEAPTDDDVERRPRGWLESDIEKLLTRIESGEVAIDDGQKLTPHFLAKKLAELEGLPKEPSTGAVSAVFDRWVKIGAATTSEHPYAFVAFTEAATAAGIAALKAGVKAERIATKQAEAAAAKQAALDAQQANAPVEAPAEEDAPVPG